MKYLLKTVFLSIYLLAGVKGYTQVTVSYLSYEYIEILSYSITITYTESGSYKPTSMYDFYGNALSTLQARYDHNREVVSQEYGKLWNLELINESNKATLNYYKQAIKEELDANSGSADFSKSSVTEEYISFISQPFRVQSISDEIKLLQSCQIELNRIKYKDPDNYIYSKRYKSIVQTLELLKNCSVSDIKYLSWENTELNNNSNYSTEESNLATKPTKKRGNVFWLDEWCTDSYSYTNPNSNIKIDCITESETQTLVRFTATPSKEFDSGWWVNFSPNAFILIDSKKYYLQEYGGIPLSPEKYYFSSINDKLSFTLYFEKAHISGKSFDIFEGVEGGFNFYNIHKTK